MTNRRFPEWVPVTVTQKHLDTARCQDPNKCAIKLAVKEATGASYVKVDSTGVAITRRPDFHEKAFLPKNAKDKMIAFDRDPDGVKPFTFRLKFFKTTPILPKGGRSRAVQLDLLAPKETKLREKLIAAKKKYERQERLTGLATARSVARHD